MYLETVRRPLLRACLTTAAAFTMLASRLGGQAPAPRPATSALTLDAAVSRALSANPELLTARFRVDSAHGEREIAGAWSNPTVSVTPANPSQYSVQLPVDLLARHYRTRAATRGVSAAEFDAVDAQRQVVFGVRQAFYDILLADSLRSLARDQALTFRRLLEADSVRLRAGSIAERDVVTTGLQLAHAEAVLARAVVQQHATRLALQTLIGRTDPDTDLLIAGTLVYRPLLVRADSVLGLALAHRPDYLASSERVRQSASLQSLARANLIPVPVIGGVYQPAQPFVSGRYIAPAIGFTVPVLYTFGGERSRARAGVAAAHVAATRTQLQVRADVALAFDGYMSARALADRYVCGLLADATNALDAARYAYERGATGLPDFLEAARSYADTRVDYLVAVHDYWVSLFALERAAGVDLFPTLQ